MISLKKKHFVIIAIALSLTIIFGCINVSRSTLQSQSESKDVSAPGFGIPINCTLGKDCFIMHYVDRDPSSKVVDFECGRQTYDGHDGTDFGIPDLKAMAKGVPVTAATAGKVLRVRDGVVDRLVEDQTDQQAVEGTECGNGVIIDRGDGWETQYCHLRNGSIAVTPGQEVEKGTVLGMVGSSGLASFPHVHLTVRYQGKVVDPFVGVNSASGCQVALDPIWDKPVEYVPTGLIRAGFAPNPPTQSQLWQGEFTEAKLSANVPALVFWVHTYGVLSGDKEYFKLTAPDGEVVLDEEKTLEKPYRSWVSFVGKRNNPESQIMSGVWRGEYRLMRGESELVEVNREVEVGQDN